LFRFGGNWDRFIRVDRLDLLRRSALEVVPSDVLFRIAEESASEVEVARKGGKLTCLKTFV
jgi:hypothetical protein